MLRLVIGEEIRWGSFESLAYGTQGQGSRLVPSWLWRELLMLTGGGRPDRTQSVDIWLL